MRLVEMPNRSHHTESLISFASSIRGSTCLRLVPFPLTSARGFTPTSTRLQRLAQLKVTAMTLRIVPFVLGARSSDFNHCSRQLRARTLGSMWDRAEDKSATAMVRFILLSY